jgi:hypothetical protein
MSVGRQVTVAYFYRVRWGFHEEWRELFRRNHYPILADQVASGRLLDVQAYAPRFHGDGPGDWTYLVTITYRDWAAVQDHAEAEIAERLFPNQELYRTEERRRFELLDAHWDVPLEARPLA